MVSVSQYPDLSQVALGFARKGEFAGRFVTGPRENDIPSETETDFEDLLSWAWWVEPALSSDYPDEHEFQLTAREATEMIESWAVDWAPREDSNYWKSMVFDQDGWIWSEYGSRWWRTKEFSRGVLFHPGWALTAFGMPQNDDFQLSSPLPFKLFTKKAAFSVVRDIAMPGRFTDGVDPKSIMREEPSLSDFVRQLEVHDVAISFVKRRGSLRRSPGSDESAMEQVTAMSPQEIRSRLMGVNRHGNQGGLISPPVRKILNDRGLEGIGLGALVSALSGTPFCISLIPKSGAVENIQMPKDPWDQFRRLARVTKG